MKNNWQPSASIESLRKRAEVLNNIRNFFDSRGYLEVETPYMGEFGTTDVNLHSIEALCNNKTFYLQTSPEHHMKRLLASGSGPIYQLARVFRAEESGRWHNPEFTLLEWYQLDIDHYKLLDEVDIFLQTILNCSSLIKKTYKNAFLESCGINPITASIKELKQILINFDLDNILSDQDDKDSYLFLLMSHVVEPFFKTLPAPLAITDFPASQAALAKVNNNLASRFEIYFHGIELANGFHELTNASIQLDRFKQDQLARKKVNYKYMEYDHRLISAINSGLPECSGVALGIERLLAILLNQDSIKNSFSFDNSRS